MPSKVRTEAVRIERNSRMPDDRHQPELPSEVSGRIGLFDRFAERASLLVSRAPFFAACVLLVLIWAPTIMFLDFDAWQLLINTATTIVTFLLVALLQNSQTRNDQATQHKLNAIADGLADLMEHIGRGEPGAATRDPRTEAGGRAGAPRSHHRQCQVRRTIERLARRRLNQLVGAARGAEGVTTPSTRLSRVEPPGGPLHPSGEPHRVSAPPPPGPLRHHRLGPALPAH